MPTITLSTGSVHYQEQGEGTPLILLHANPGDSQDFEAVMPALSQHFRVLALDWPGYGKSMMPPRPDQADCLLFYHILLEFIAAMGLSKVLVAGCSLGGNAAARLAIHQPDKVAGLILIAPGGFTPHDPISAGFCRLQGSTLALAPQMWARQYLSVQNAFTHAMLQRAGGPQSLPHRRQLNRAIWRSFARPEHDLRRDAGNIQCPVLMLFGQHDPAISHKKDGLVAQQCIPHGVKKVLPCGHMAHAEMPEAFLETVMPFLQSCESTIPA